MPSHPLRAYAASVACALAAAHVFAQSPSAAPAILDPIVVTASRSPQPLLDLVADLTVIDADEIARSGADGLAALLARQPGVEMIRNGGAGATSGVFLRGANAAQTLVLIDGVRVASASSGATALEAIPLAQIERIEILRGPASSLYGADAIGGVIQVFTRKGGEGVHANASASYGTFDTWNGTAGISGGAAAARGSVQVAGRRSDGFNAIVNPANLSYDPDRDGYRDASVTANGALDYASGQSLSLDYFRSRLDNQFDAGDAFDDRTVTTLESSQVASSNRLSAAWLSRLSAAEGRDRSVSKTGFGEFPFETRQRQYAWQNDIALAAAGTLTVALERREERVAADAGFAVTARDTNAATAVYRVDAGAHAVQANVRHDDSTQFGGRTTGALAWGWRLAPGWRVTASAGTAFKAPTFNDLYFPGFSNADLRPETSRDVEAGLHWSARAGEAAWQVHAVAFRNRVDDLIVFGCNADFVCRPDNVARATLRGVTLHGDYLWHDTIARASLDLQSPSDDAGGLLPRRARRHGALSLEQGMGKMRFVGEIVASSERFDDAENRRRLGGYAVVNLVVEWLVAPSTTLFVRADNVFDRQYELAADFATGGAQVMGGVRWKL